MSAYAELSVIDLALGFVLMLVAYAVAALQRFGVLKSMVWGTCRAVAQLSAMGFVLTAVFAATTWWPLLLVLAVMIGVGGRTATQRVKRPLPLLWVWTTMAIAVASVLVTGYVLLFIFDLDPWYSPRYAIPLAAMVTSFCMNAVTFAADRLTLEANTRRPEIEALLSLGASPRRAMQSAIKEALRTAWTPTINHLMVVGVVQLPGMMTGLIIAGASPAAAVRYQILIAFMLSGGTAISTVAIMELTWRRLFNAREQLVVPPPR